MRAQLEDDIQESRTTCAYAEGCSILRDYSAISSEEATDRYTLICSTTGRYNCSRFIQMEGRRK